MVPRSILFVGIVAIAAPAVAGTKEVLDSARQMGTIMAAERYCSMSFDRRKLQSYFARNVPSDDHRWGPWFDQFQREGLDKQRAMTVAEGEQHCAVIRKTVTELGIL